MIALAVLAGAALLATPPAATPATAATGPQGKKLFADNCARCHDADGRAQGPYGKQHSIPDFTAPAFGKKHTAKDLAATISAGDEEADMPAFGGKLPPADIDAVAAYVLSLSASPKK